MKFIFFWNKLIFIKQEARQSALQSNGGPAGIGSDHQQSEPNIYVVNSSSMSMDQPLSSVTTTTSVLPDVTGKKYYYVFKSKIINMFWISKLYFTILNFLRPLSDTWEEDKVEIYLFFINFYLDGWQLPIIKLPS